MKNMSCDYILYILLGIGIILFMGIIVGCIAIVLNYFSNKKIQELTRYNINLSAVIDETIPSLLESFIQNCLNDYLIVTGEAISDNYITEDAERKLRDDLVVLVVERISNNMIDKLSAYYNKRNIANIISDKIYMIVTSYVVDHNANLSDMNKK